MGDIQPPARPVPDPSKAKVKTWYVDDKQIAKWNEEEEIRQKEEAEMWLLHPSHPNNLGK